MSTERNVHQTGVLHGDIMVNEGDDNSHSMVPVRSDAIISVLTSTSTYKLTRRLTSNLSTGFSLLGQN
jgi:hypothetical protein